MAREIKFRAWLPSWEEMDYAHEKSDVEWSWRGNKFVLEIYHDDGFCGGMQEFEDVKIMQYTGLTDKDGKEIYEGDVIDDSYISPLSGEKIEKKYVIEFEDGCFWAKMIPSHPYGSTYLDFKHKKSVVIGNIHENPELI